MDAVRTEIAVREACHRDLDDLMRLLAQLDPPGSPPIDRSLAETVWNRVAEVPGYSVHLAELDAVVVGTFSMLVMPSLSHRGAPGAVLESVVVDGSRRGAGVGRAMMERAAGIATAAGCYKLTLSSGLPREGAHRFYERLGFLRHGVSFLLPLESAHA